MLMYVFYTWWEMQIYIRICIKCKRTYIFYSISQFHICKISASPKASGWYVRNRCWNKNVIKQFTTRKCIFSYFLQ